jgi:hypothetical protein
MRELLKTRLCRENLDLRGRKCQEAGDGCIMRSFLTCTLQEIL